MSLMHGQQRKSSFKAVPPADKEASQHARRARALEEQKQKRAQYVDSSRNLHSFAGLSLGSDDDEPDGDPEIIQGSLAQFASLLPRSGEIEGASIKSSSSEKRKSKKPNTYYANKIMYAELLEMKEDLMLQMDHGGHAMESDGLPMDLETNWVALAPVPRGKRCLAVANQSSGVPGTVSNTFLKSRLKGRTILTFPSPLPPSTILDCILDDRWKQNGILHVLDIIRWKGQEVGDCETNFRFWWRDTRLSELLPSLPPILPDIASPEGSHSPQVFSYPVVLLPVPYHLDLSLSSLLSTLISLSRSVRQVTIKLPSQSILPDSAHGTMDVDQQPAQSVTATTDIQPDGLLLYVTQASYDPGTSPLSSWVPIKRHEEGGESPLDVFERLVRRRASVSLQTQDTIGFTEIDMEH